MGALICDQIIWGYLSAGKLDGGTNVADNDAGTLVDGKNYTQMEHYWDEVYSIMLKFSKNEDLSVLYDK